MDYKEKYEMALERAKKEWNDNLDNAYSNYREHLEIIFPELKGSEDEKIRKKFIKLVKMSNKVGGFALHKWEADEMLAWLEKQKQIKKINLPESEDFEKELTSIIFTNTSSDELSTEKVIELGHKIYMEVLEAAQKEIKQKPIKCSEEDEKIRKALLELVHDTTGDELWVDYNVHKEEALAWLEKQGEQNPVNKVEPKFNVGDWIINRTDGTIMQIVNNKDFYESVEIGGQRRTDTYNYVEWDFRLWTIQDAKEGDVLVASDGSIFLFAGVVDLGCRYYIALEVEDETIQVNDNFEHCWESVTGVCPATEEQRDLLFEKMKEAGYMWNAEKLELKKYKPVEKKEVTGKLKEMLDNIDPVELEETKKEMMESMPTDEEVQKLHDHLEMHKQLPKSEPQTVTFIDSGTMQVIDKLNEVIGKLGDIHQILSKPFQFPYKDYTPPQEPWYKTHGVEKVTPVTCETLNSIETDNGKDNDKEMEL